MTDDLETRFGSAKHPERPREARPAGTDDATIDAVGKISAAFEIIENARGFLYGFHRMSGEADLNLQDGVKALKDAGHADLAAEIERVLVGRDVVRDMWTYQIVEAYDEQYYRVFQAVDDKVRRTLSNGRPHVYEAEMKVTEQSDTEQSDTEQSDTEQSDTEQSDTEQSDTEQSDTQQTKTEQSDTQ